MLYGMIGSGTLPGLIALLALSSACAPDPTGTSEPLPAPAAPAVAAVRSQAFPVTSLGTLPFGQFSAAQDINAASAVAGYSAYSGSGDIHAFFWTQGAGMVDLGTLDTGFGVFQSAAFAINDNNEVVGWSDKFYASLRNRAFYWSPASGMVELPSDTFYEARAYDINNA